ncbi:MAG: RpiB/LacA/LacB family sugar-phosphate isomerase, partial [Dysgonomonas sp.]
MKIALMNEFSQASKNEIVLKELKDVVEPMGHEVYNTGMIKDGDEPYLTYLHLGIQAALLLNSKAVDFVVSGCGTGQGALMSLNAYPGVVCGYCIEPTDAYLFLQINNGNALSIPFATGFGWGAELNIRTMFEKAFGRPKGQGYPTDPGS